MILQPQLLPPGANIFLNTFAIESQQLQIDDRLFLTRPRNRVSLESQAMMEDSADSYDELDEGELIAGTNAD